MQLSGMYLEACLLAGICSLAKYCYKYAVLYNVFYLMVHSAPWLLLVLHLQFKYAFHHQ